MFLKTKAQSWLNIKVDYSKGTYNIDIEFSLSNDNEYTNQNIEFHFCLYGIESIVPIDLLLRNESTMGHMLKYYTPSIDTILVKGIDFKTVLSRSMYFK